MPENNPIEIVPVRTGGYAIRRKCGPWSREYNRKGAYEYLNGPGAASDDWSFHHFGEQFAAVWPTEQAAITEYMRRILLEE